MKKYTTAQRLKQIMSEKNIKQIDILNKIQPICEKLDIKMGSNDLSQYVSGKVEPSQKKLSALAEVLDTNEVWLMGYDVPNDKNLSANNFPIKDQYISDMMYEDLGSNYNSFTQLSLQTGISVTEIKKILNRENKLPKPKYLKQIADASNQDVELYLIGCGYIESIEDDDALYDSGIRFLLNEDDRQDLCDILKEIWSKNDKNLTTKEIYSNLFNTEKEEFSVKDIKNILNNNLSFDNAESIDISSNIVKIPVLGVIKAGMPIEAQENILEYVDIPKSWTSGDRKYYGLKVNGDSMYPKYQENDIVIFEQTEDYTIANKKDCAVMVNGFDATFKNVTITESGITLVPLNLNNSENYQPTFYNEKQVKDLPVKIIGIAREKRTRIE